MKKILFTVCFLVIATITVNAQQSEYLKLKGPYLGQKLPGLTPEIFAQGIISTPLREHSSVTISPDGKEIYFTRQEENGDLNIYYLKYNGSVWTVPVKAPFNSEFLEDGAAFSPDGKRLYFTSRRPSSVNPNQLGDIWYVERNSKGWGNPILLPEPINTEYDESHACFTSSGTMYFHSTRGKNSNNADIYRSEYIDNKFTEPERLENSINNSSFQGAPYVSPDESYILYFQINLIENPKPELYLSFKKGKTTWTKPINVVEKLHLKADDILSARLSPDGKYLFILDNGDVYWISAKIIEVLKPVD